MRGMIGRKRKRRWEDLPAPIQRGVSIMAVAQIALFLYALVDLIRRSEDEIRGRKFMWYPALFVNFVGPLAYLFIGRKKDTSGSDSKTRSV